MRFFVSLTPITIFLVLTWLSKDVAHATKSISATPQLTTSEEGPAGIEKETQINLSNENKPVDKLDNDLFALMKHGELLIRTKRHKHSHHRHQSCSKRKKHHGHCDHQRKDHHQRKKDQRHRLPTNHHNKATSPDRSQPSHTNGPEQIPNRGSTGEPEQFPNRPTNDRGGTWSNEETAIDEWSINRRKENRRKTQYSDALNP